MSLENSNAIEPHELVSSVQSIEERLFADQLNPDDARLMHGGEGYSFFRPSHHFRSGLMPPKDLKLLKQEGKRMLSLGTGPGYFERVLLELGIPPENMVVSDADPRVLSLDIPTEKRRFDMHHSWPEMDNVDRIIFPESLTISIVDKQFQYSKPMVILRGREDKQMMELVTSTDYIDTLLLTEVIKQSYKTLLPNGVIRANGTIRGRHILGMMSTSLQEANLPHDIVFHKRLLEITKTNTNVVPAVLADFAQQYQCFIESANASTEEQNGSSM